MWRGQTVVILGGGPSLTQAQIEACRGRARVIAINTAYLAAPWADLLYFCDSKWWSWHQARLPFRTFAGIVAALDSELRDKPECASIRFLQNMGAGPGLYDQPDGVFNGRNSGYQAINLAAHARPRRLILLGFDMRAIDSRTHWHDEHKVKDPISVYTDTMLPNFPTLVAPLAQRGIEIVNATPGSALTCFPMQPLEVALGLREAA